MSTIIIIGGGGQGGGGNQNNVTAMDDGSIVDERDGTIVARFKSYDDAISYLSHLNNHGLD